MRSADNPERPSALSAPGFRDCSIRPEGLIPRQGSERQPEGLSLDFAATASGSRPPRGFPAPSVGPSA